MDKEKIEAFFDRNLNLWRVDLAEKCLDDSKEGAELRAEYKLRIYKEAEQLEADNERIKEENRWIPVSERLPTKDSGAYVVYATHKIFEPMLHLASFTLGDFVFNDWDDWTVTHWKPIILPEQALVGREG